jgi:hypothetical protein
VRRATTGAIAAGGPEYTTVATLPNLAAGSYVLLAKVHTSTDQTQDVDCELAAGSATDDASTTMVLAPSKESAHATLNMQMVVTLGAATNITLGCRSGDHSWFGNDISIVAVAVGSASSQAVTG